MTKKAELQWLEDILRDLGRLSWLLVVAVVSALYVLGFAVIQCFRSDDTSASQDG